MLFKFYMLSKDEKAFLYLSLCEFCNGMFYIFFCKVFVLYFYRRYQLLCIIKNINITNLFR